MEWKINLGFLVKKLYPWGIVWYDKKKKFINFGLKINIPWSVKLFISESVQGHLFRSSCKDNVEGFPPWKGFLCLYTWIFPSFALKDESQSCPQNVQLLFSRTRAGEFWSPYGTGSCKFSESSRVLLGIGRGSECNGNGASCKIWERRSRGGSLMSKSLKKVWTWF